MKILKKVALATIVTASSLYAHGLWVNSFESFTHKPGHTMVSLGWGHSLPIDDILKKVIIKEFSIISPSGEKIELDIPKSKDIQATKTSTNFEVFDAQIGLQKVALKKESEKGVYLVQAKTKPTFYTKYIDIKNRTRLKLKSKDKIKDIKKVLMSMKYQAFAKSYLTIGKWSEQKAVGHDLEIIPKTDLSNLKVGNLVEFEVLFHGKPLNMGPQTIAYITAHSSSFGQSQGFSLFSKIKKGKAQFVVQSSGQWMVDCIYKEDVKKDGSLKELYGKTNRVFNGATLTFNVK